MTAALGLCQFIAVHAKSFHDLYSVRLVNESLMNYDRLALGPPTQDNITSVA